MNNQLSSVYKVIITGGMLALALFYSSFLFAAETGGRYECNYAGNQQEMNVCAIQDYTTADKSLNKIYHKVMSVLSPSRQITLKAEQRTWVKKRDSECRLETKESEGGSIWPLEFYGCLKSATQDRIKELNTVQTSPKLD